MFYADISSGICCMFETLTEGEIKMYRDIVLFPWDGRKSKWIISLENQFLSCQLIDSSVCLYRCKINLIITV